VQGAENQDQPSHEHDVEGITVMVFNPDVHVVSDPGLRVAIEQFHPDIQGQGYIDCGCKCIPKKYINSRLG
jgi:hypothetical protein